MRVADFKNKTAYGSKMLKMNDETYKLRKKVINIIYDVNKFCNKNNLQKLPRIEVRIVSDIPKCKEGKYKGSKIIGYAYEGGKVIHIPETTLNFKDNKILFVVLHEILHSIGFKHKKGCPLMNPFYKDCSEVKMWDTLLKYIIKYSKS